MLFGLDGGRRRIVSRKFSQAWGEEARERRGKGAKREAGCRETYRRDAEDAEEGAPRLYESYGRTAQARPSGPWPVGMWSVTSSLCRSITATALSPASAT